MSTKGAQLSQQRNVKARTRNGIRINVYVHEDADALLDEMASERGRSRTDVLEQAIYDAWYLHQAQKKGEKILLFDPAGNPPYREVVLDIRQQVRRSS